VKQKVWRSSEARDYGKMRREKTLEGFLETSKKPGISIVFKSKSVLMAVALICIQGSTMVAIDDTFPLWAMQAPPIGVGFTSGQIGFAWSMGGVSMFIFQAFLYTRVIKKISPLGGIKLGSGILVVVFTLFPWLGKFGGTPWVWPAMAFVLMGRYVGGSLSGSTLNMLLNVVGGPEVQKHRGVVNGFSMSVRGAAMAFSPFLASSVFAWSARNGLSFPLDYHLEFFILSICSFVVLLGTFLIPKSETS